MQLMALERATVNVFNLLKKLLDFGGLFRFAMLKKKYFWVLSVLFQSPFIPLFSLFSSAFPHLVKKAVVSSAEESSLREDLCSLPRNDDAFVFWSDYCFLVWTAVLLDLEQKAVGTWGPGSPTVCRAGWPPGALVSWFNHVNHAWSVLWYFLFSSVLETPVLDVENLRFSAKPGLQGLVKVEHMSLLQELFWLLNQYCGAVDEVACNFHVAFTRLRFG